MQPSSLHKNTFYVDKMNVHRQVESSLKHAYTHTLIKCSAHSTRWKPNPKKQETSGCFISVAPLWLSHLCCGSGPRWPTAIFIDSVCSVAPCLSYCPSEAIIKTGWLWCVLWLFTKRLLTWWIIKTVAQCAAPPDAVHCLPALPISQRNIAKQNRM